MWEQAAADISQTVHSVFSPLPHLISMLQVRRRSWRWWKRKADSQLLFSPPLASSCTVLRPRSSELVLVQKVCVQQALLRATECTNHSEQDEVMSQQVGDHNTCPMTQLELRAALPTSAFEGITDVFLLVCRHIKPLCVLLKILQQRPGTATTQSPTWLTGSVFLISDLQQGRTSDAGELPAMKKEIFFLPNP